jgi:hypothetical protein
MSEPIICRQAIAQQADDAARRAVQTEADQTNPYPVGSDAAAEWARRYHIALLKHSATEVSA